MCTIKFSIELNTFQTDNKDPNTNICEKIEQIFKMDNASMHHPPIYKSFLDDSPVCHLPSKVLRVSMNYSQEITRVVHDCIAVVILDLTDTDVTIIFRNE